MTHSAASAIMRIENEATLQLTPTPSVVAGLKARLSGVRVHTYTSAVMDSLPPSLAPVGGARWRGAVWRRGRDGAGGAGGKVVVA